MQTLTVHGIVSDKGMLRIETIETPVDLPPGSVEVEVTIRPALKVAEPSEWKWADLYGLGAEIWRGVDVKEYLRELREDREIRR
jgi:hypothetical protein